MKNILLLFLLLASFSVHSTAQIVINEFSASNLNSFTDSFGKTEDWIELYNTSSTEVDISGWYLSDKAGNPDKWEIPSGTIIPANGFLVFLCSARDGIYNGEFHTNFRLSQTTANDIVLLADANEDIIESHTLDLTLVEHSHCRSIDGGTEWKISTAPSFGTSNDNTPQINGYTQTPSMDLEAGFYEGTQLVTITNNEPNSTLRYTLDGTNPTESSPEYTGPIFVTQTQVIKAQAFSNDPLILPGKMDFNTYLIDEDFTLAVFSVAADDVIDLANGDGALIPIGSIEYFNLNKEREATSFGSLNRHGQDSWVLPHRSLDWISRDEMGYSKAVDAPLFSYSERDEYQKFMFRNSGDDNYPAINDGAHEGSTHIRDEYVHTLAQLGEMKLDVRAVERVILFLNGQYWGVYGMRERPVDHDYTGEYYDQGKYEVQYLSTWGSSEVEYGGLQAVADWENLRNFILENDMGNDENYELVGDSLNLVSLIDYFLMNQNVVAMDWLNYNTGWWRGRNPDGDHKKWGYILWDLDATFDYYINYTGVPNTSPDASPCDLNVIDQSMDNFFGDEIPNYGDGTTTIDTIITGGPVIIDTSIVCQTILNGSSPYPITDTIFQIVIEEDPYCCAVDWDGICQNLYDDTSIPDPDGVPDTTIVINDVDLEFLPGNVGAHEKLILKLLSESPEFRNLYFTRYADLMNTVFTCENMNTVLDSMVAMIVPEMPRQIERWGGSLQEWESNVDDLRDFINQRCMLLDDVAIDCFDNLTETHNVVLQTIPDGIGEIDLNSLDIEEFTWTGDYFGGIINDIKAKVFDEYEDDYEFSHWMSSSGNTISPNEEERKATIIFNQPDTLTAVFEYVGVVNTQDLNTDYSFRIYPNPAKDYVMVDYSLDKTMDLHTSLFSVVGQELIQFPQISGRQSAGQQMVKLPLDNDLISTGLYYLVIRVDNEVKTFKVNIVR